MPSSPDRKRLEVPTHLHERLVEIAIEEDRTVSSVVQEIINLGLSQYDSRARGAAGSERYTERARRALEFAREETQPFNHHYLGTEHLLLGLLRESEGVAGRVLRKLGVELEPVREYIAYHMGRGSGPAPTELPYAPRARRSLRLAEEEAERLDSPYVGTEHLLLGLVRVQDGMGARILGNFVALDRVRNETLRLILMLNEPTADAAKSPSKPSRAETLD